VLPIIVTGRELAYMLLSTAFPVAEMKYAEIGDINKMIKTDLDNLILR